MRRWFIHSPGRYALALVLGAGLTALGLYFRKSLLPIWWADSLSIAGAVLVLLGLLGLMARLGTFDMAGYAVSTLGNRRYRDLYEYSRAKAEKRSHTPPGFVPFIAVGAVFLAAGLILRCTIK